jgi:S-adenosylmethionine:tRNA ribosyltransferase-isomerase
LYNEFDINSYDYELPERLIAQTPVEPRDASRLLIYDKAEDKIIHKRFSDITDYLKEGDVLVLNNTRVMPARLFAIKKDTGAKIEILLLKKLNLTDFEALVKPGKKVKTATELIFSDKLRGVIKGGADGGARIISFKFARDLTLESLLAEIGEVPLPPYIKQKLTDKERYQTVYAKEEGSSAASTAGLHFTKELLEAVKAKGVAVAEINLHIGLGTFRPVKTDDITKHKMHSEYYEIDRATAGIINRAKREGRRIICVGTTPARALESACGDDGLIRETKGYTDIFIYPSYKFKAVSALITNFHLPKSSLLMLISAFLSIEKVKEIYKEAVENEYRFFSFGDACFFF